MSHQIRDEVMNTFPRKLTTLGTELWHIVIIPIFFLVFAALYRPVGLDALLGMDRGFLQCDHTFGNNTRMPGYHPLHTLLPAKCPL